MGYRTKVGKFGNYKQTNKTGYRCKNCGIKIDWTEPIYNDEYCSECYSNEYE